MSSSTPSTPTPILPRSRLVLAVVAFGLHGVAIWLMGRGGLLVDRAPQDAQVAWLSLQAAAPPPRASPRASGRRPTRAPGPADAVPAPIVAPEPPSADAPAGIDATANAAGAAPPAREPPLDMRLPPRLVERAAPLTPAQEAMRDPRSNTLRPAPAERWLLALGDVECIAWQRLPDGSIFRGPGHLREVPGLPARTDGTRVHECVR